MLWHHPSLPPPHIQTLEATAQQLHWLTELSEVSLWNKQNQKISHRDP